MNMPKDPPGKIIVILLVILIVVVVVFGAGYYLSIIRFDQKFNDMNEKFEKFEGKYEVVLSSLSSDLMEMKAYLKEKEGKAVEEANQLKVMSILLKAKGEIISSKLALSRREVDKSLEHLDTSISVLKDALDVAVGEVKDEIEDLRLRLATVKGIMEVNSHKAQEELDTLWREIDNLTSK
ncbi:MAG: hypothetical protein ACETWK_11135 [Candidatus Aminicenantaceae bacterium]